MTLIKLLLVVDTDYHITSINAYIHASLFKICYKDKALQQFVAVFLVVIESFKFLLIHFSQIKSILENNNRKNRLKEYFI